MMRPTEVDSANLNKIGHVIVLMLENRSFDHVLGALKGTYPEVAGALDGIAQLAAADPRDNHHFVRHDEWKKGAKIHQDDWQRGDRVDYRQSHLRAPPNGYEWRMVDGNYVLAAVATGVIASVVAVDIAAH